MKGECSTSERLYGKLMTFALIGWNLISLPWFLLRLWIGPKLANVKPPDLGDDPITRAYGEIWDRRGRAIQSVVLHLEPATAALRVAPEAPAGERDRVLRLLREMQADIAALVELSLEQPAAWPVLENFDAFSGVHMKHPRAWFQNFVRVMSADAARCWEEGDASGVAVRLGAIFRWAGQCAGQPDGFTRMIARMLMQAGHARLAAQLEDGLGGRLSQEQRGDLADEVELARKMNTWRSDWAAQVTRLVAEARKALESGGPAAVLAELAPLGQYTEDMAVQPAVPVWCGRCTLPLRWRLAAVRKLGREEIHARFTAAERIVASITQAPDDAVELAVLAAVEESAVDPTHLLRAIINSPGPMYAILLREETQSASVITALRA